jgi:dihydroneopterin triphosphate diphosphatase
LKLISNLIEAHIFREDDQKLEFLLLKRSNYQIYPGVWQMVSGKIDKSEKAFETALREIKEETGIVPENMWVVPRVNSFYTADTDTICLVPVFACLVRSNLKIVLSTEHCEYKWVTSREAKQLLAWDGQRKAVDLIEEYFPNEKKFLNFTEVKII